MKILHLTLKKKWFDMIASGEKKEEYRERKKYWYDRLTSEVWINAGTPTASKHYNFLHFDVVEFRNGYGKDSPKITVRFMGVCVRVGRQDWGAEPNTEYFVIKLGEVVEQKLVTK